MLFMCCVRVFNGILCGFRFFTNSSCCDVLYAGVQGRFEQHVQPRCTGVHSLVTDKCTWFHMTTCPLIRDRKTHCTAELFCALYTSGLEPDMNHSCPCSLLRSGHKGSFCGNLHLLPLKH